MGLRIKTNLPSLIAQRNLRSTRGSLDKNLERLSSGYRINGAGDDAAGLAISEGFRAQIRGLDQAQRNAQDGVSVVQVAEGALSEISNILIRLRELAVQASSDTVGLQERDFMNVEFQQMLSEIERISDSTEYNGVKLLSGSASAFQIQIGLHNNDKIDRIQLFDPYKADINPVSMGIHLTGVGDKQTAQATLALLDSAMQKVVSIRAEFGAMQNRLEKVINNVMLQKENVSSANSRIRDSDLAEEVAGLTKNKILMEAGISVLAQTNSAVESSLRLLTGG